MKFASQNEAQIEFPNFHVAFEYISKEPNNLISVLHGFNIKTQLLWYYCGRRSYWQIEPLFSSRTHQILMLQTEPTESNVLSQTEHALADRWFVIRLNINRVWIQHCALLEVVLSLSHSLCRLCVCARVCMCLCNVDYLELIRIQNYEFVCLGCGQIVVVIDGLADLEIKTVVEWNVEVNLLVTKVYLLVQ